MIFTVRTDKPEAELGLYSPDGHPAANKTWYAHRQLADTLLVEIRNLLQSQSSGFDDLTGIVVFQGPGSFTGLRIGITVANTLAYAQKIPIVGATGDDWVKAGLVNLAAGADQRIVLPEYGAEAHITAPKK